MNFPQISSGTVAEPRYGPPLTTAGRKKRVKMIEDAADSLQKLEAQALHLSQAVPAFAREIARVRDQLELASAPPPPEEK